MRMKYTTILFDADNTLLDFDKSEHIALVKTLNFYGVDTSDENISTYVKINQSLWKQLEKKEITRAELKQIRFRRFFDAIGFSFNGDTLEVNEHYLNELSNCGYIMDGADELCKKLTEKGYILYIVTNGIAKAQNRRLEKSGLLPYISDVYISESIGYPKPDKRFFDHVLQNIAEKDKSRIVVIGDSLSSDITGAHNSSLDSIWLNLNGESSPVGPEPVHTVSRLNELEAILI